MKIQILLCGFLMSCAGLAGFSAPTETEVFGNPDWQPPVAWKLPQVCGRDFWTILKYPPSDGLDCLYDECRGFRPGDEPQNFAIFRETGYWLAGQLKYYAEHRAQERQVPVYVTGIRYATGKQFIPPEQWPEVDEFWTQMRKRKEAGLPEDAIDGNRQTCWAFSKLLPQWLICELPEKTVIDRVRFAPYHIGQPVWRFFIEVSSDGRNWDMVADKRENAEPVMSEEGIDLRFSPREVKFVRLTVTFVDRNSNVAEVEAYHGTVKIPFARAEASSSCYEDAFMTFKQRQELAKSLGESFLGFSTEEWGNDVGHLRNYWDGDTNRFQAEARPYAPKKPESAADYLAFLRNEYRRLTALSGGKLFDLESSPRFVPYAAEWGGSLAVEEFHLAGPNNYSFCWDILRGAARQHGLPILAYLTSYNGGDSSRTRRTHKQPLLPGFTKPWNDANPHNGVSLLFQKRWLWFNYLSGANLVDFRETSYFYDRDEQRNIQQLSPLGRLQAEWYEQAKKHPDRGVRATPIAIAFDYAHLLPADLKFASGGSDEEETKAFDSIVAGGSFYDGVLRREQPPNYSFITVDEARQSSFRPEHAALRNRSFGEVFDWIMLNAPSGTGEKALPNYRAVYLLGRVDATPALSAALRSFLERGGKIIAQASHAPLIPEEYRAIAVKSYIDDSEDIHDEFTGRDYHMAPYEGPVLKENVKSCYRLALVEERLPVRKVCRDKVNRPVVLWSKAGKGGIFWVLAESHGHNFFPVNNDLLKQIADHALPVRVSGDIQWLANKTANGWVIGLLNNHGVYPKDPYQEPEIDPRDEKQVTLEYPGRLADVREWLTGKALPVERCKGHSRLSVTVPAGDIRIVQFKTRD